jgi:hypothetical protein
LRAATDCSTSQRHTGEATEAGVSTNNIVIGLHDHLPEPRFASAQRPGCRFDR